MTGSRLEISVVIPGQRMTLNEPADRGNDRIQSWTTTCLGENVTGMGHACHPIPYRASRKKCGEREGRSVSRTNYGASSSQLAQTGSIFFSFFHFSFLSRKRHFEFASIPHRSVYNDSNVSPNSLKTNNATYEEHERCVSDAAYQRLADVFLWGPS